MLLTISAAFGINCVERVITTRTSAVARKVNAIVEGLCEKARVTHNRTTIRFSGARLHQQQVTKLRFRRALPCCTVIQLFSLFFPHATRKSNKQ